MLPTDSKERKDTPIFSGVLMYFPDAIAEVAKVSKIGNDKHNPGQPLHWSRGKSDDHLDAASRHLIDAGPDGSGTDENGVLHLAYNAWRSLAKLQLVCEARDAQGVPFIPPPPPASIEVHRGCPKALVSRVGGSRICKLTYGHSGDCELSR